MLFFFLLIVSNQEVSCSITVDNDENTELEQIEEQTFLGTFPDKSLDQARILPDLPNFQKSNIHFFALCPSSSPITYS